MLTLIRTALRSFAIGLVVGVLVAPRPGAETRRLLRQKVQGLVNQLLEVGGLPPIRLEGPAGRERERRAEDVGAATPA